MLDILFYLLYDFVRDTKVQVSISCLVRKTFFFKFFSIFFNNPTFHQLYNGYEQLPMPRSNRL